MISIIIPAFNEEGTIARVISAATAAGIASEVIVVDDGSTDATSRIASSAGVTVVHTPENKGKGEAMVAGVAASTGDILLFLDADLRGLLPEHVRRLAEPVQQGGADMVVGMIGRWEKAEKLSEDLISPISGIRCIKKSFWQEIPSKYKKGFSIETAITKCAKEWGLRVEGVTFAGVKHTIKEKKYGLAKGFWGRLRMGYEVAAAYILLLIGK